MSTYNPSASLYTSTSALPTQPKPPSQPGATLTSLLAQANSLNRTDADGDTELPQIRLNIDEIERMSESVAGRGKRQRRTDAEGYTLLTNLGINTSHLSHSIAQLPGEAPKTWRRRHAPVASRLEPVGDLGPAYAMADGDISAWGRNWHEMVILSGIEVQRQKTVRAFNAQFQQRMLANWEAEKARVMQDELGVTDEEMFRLAAAGNLGKSALGSSTRRFPMAAGAKTQERDGGMVMHTKMLKYEKTIAELNQSRLRRTPYELCQALSATVSDETKYPLLPTMYRLLAYLTHEPSLRDVEGAEPVQERQYAQAYLGDQRGSQAGLLRGRLVNGGKGFLEKDFENHMDETIAKNPKEAALGGMPGIANKVRAYVDVTMRAKDAQDLYRPEMVDGKYLYAQVYYLLRAGYPSEAVSLLQSHASSLRKEDTALPGAFSASLSSSSSSSSSTTSAPSLPKPLRDQLFNDFNAHLRNNPSADQFKFALYKLVGRFEMNRKSVKVASATTEDWVWFQLSLVREGRGGSGSGEEGYGLEDVARLVGRYGAEKFDQGGTKPLSWIMLLLYTGQFEKAVAYMHSKQALKTDAVHLAIALAYYGLLRPTQSDDADLLVEESDTSSSLNFSRLIKQYISPIAHLSPPTALQYAYLIALSSDAPHGIGERQRAAALSTVRDVVLASKSWSKLLGSVRADGSKETGLIERDLSLLHLSSSDEYLKEVVLAAADQSARDASLTDAIELYHLAGATDRVVDSVNRALGQSLSSTHAQPSGLSGGTASVGLSGAFGGAAGDLESLARRVKSVYERDWRARERVGKTGWETLGVLLELKSAMSLFAQDRPDLALETLQKTSLLPLDGDASAIPRCTSAFRALLDQPTISSLDDVVVTAMKCLHRLSQQLKQSPYGDQGRTAQLGMYKQMAQCLVQFAGGVRLRLGGDVYRQLSSMSAFF